MASKSVRGMRFHSAHRGWSTSITEMLRKYRGIPSFNGSASAFWSHSYLKSVEALEAVEEQSDQDVLMHHYFKELTVEEEKAGIVMSRRALIAVYPALEWIDDLGACHDLTLFGSDVEWLSEMNVSLEDIHARDPHNRQVRPRALP